MRLIIVESPNKVAKIQRYAGAGFKVVASSGHIRDLPARRIGIHIEDGRFEPVWEVSDKAREHVRRIAAEARLADEVLLGTDPDREGEAIAWHLIEECRIPRAKIRRISFNEITQAAVSEAIANPVELDEALVAAAISRRLIDRFVGYEVSPVLQGLSRDLRAAGRVQTPTLYFVVERERERDRFVKKTYWTVGFEYSNGLEVGALAEKRDPSGVIIPEVDDGETEFDDVEPATAEDDRPGLVLRQFETPAAAEAFALDLAARTHRVTHVDREISVRYPLPPFTTDSLLAEASRRLRLAADFTMRLAQTLFESGLITYHRTDSTTVSAEGIILARETIARWAPEVLPEESAVHFEDPRAQGAHEGIRPTAEGIEAVEHADPLASTPGAASLLRLIAARFVSSQATPTLIANTLVLVDAGGDTLFARGTLVEDPGHSLFYSEYSLIREKELPSVEVGESLVPTVWNAPRRETSAPRRHTEATLIEKMHRTGIGRPSTYAATLKSLINHGLIVEKGRDIAPTHAGSELVDVMTEMLPGLLSPEYTARTEALLDEIGAGRASSNRVLAEWYAAHRIDLEEARRIAGALGRGGSSREVVGKCAECGLPIERRMGKFGPYVRCPNGHKPRVARRPAGVTCPDCGAEMVIKTGSSGEFLGCSRFPNCKRTLEITWAKPDTQAAAPVRASDVAVRTSACPECGAELRRRRRKSDGKQFLGCSAFPQCRAAIECDEPAAAVGEPHIVSGCPDCEAQLETTDAFGLRFAVCTVSVTCYGCGLPLKPEGAESRRFWRCQCTPERMTTSKLLARARIGHLFLSGDTDRRGRRALHRLDHLAECPECRAAPEPVRADDEIVWVCQCGTRTAATLERGVGLLVETSGESMRTATIRQDIDVSCPKCNRPMRVKSGSRGRFLSCSAFPTCDGSMDLDDSGLPVERLEPFRSGPRRERIEIELPTCPDCGAAMVPRSGSAGDFVGCSAYPACKRTIDTVAAPGGGPGVAGRESSSDGPDRDRRDKAKSDTANAEVATPSRRGARACAECGSAMQERRGGRAGIFLGCTAFPRCRYTEAAPTRSAVTIKDC